MDNNDMNQEQNNTSHGRKVTADNISQAAHLIGGGCGSVFGFAVNKKLEEKAGK